MKLGNALKTGITLLSVVGGVAGGVEVVRNVTTDTVTNQNNTVVVDETNIEYKHIINTSDTYIINGVEVTLEEFNNTLNQPTTEEVKQTKQAETKSITFSVNDLDIDGVARLAEYLDFEYDKYNNVIGAKVRSDKVTSISYEYSNGYLANFSDDLFTSNGLTNLVYQDVTRTDGLVFTIGDVTMDGYEITNEVEAIIDNYVFKMIKNPAFVDLTFDMIFNTITIEVIE